jgi:hypothetical protein
MSALDVISGIGIWLMLPALAVVFFSAVIFVGRSFVRWRATGLLPSYDDLIKGAEYQAERTTFRFSMIVFISLFFVVAALKPTMGLLSVWHSMAFG